MPLAAVSCSSLLAQTSKTPGDDATLVRRTPQGGSPPPRCEPVAWAHISGEMIALDDGIEALEAVAHGYRAGGFVAGIAGPSAEAGDGPAGPGEGLSPI